jgi:hypothetical protein
MGRTSLWLTNTLMCSLKNYQVSCLTATLNSSLSYYLVLPLYTGDPIGCPQSSSKSLRSKFKNFKGRGIYVLAHRHGGAHVIFVPKKGGTQRMCVDYCALNEVIEKTSILCHGLMIFFYQLRGACVFSKIDLQSGYHQLKIRESDIPRPHSSLGMGYVIILSCLLD